MTGARGATIRSMPVGHVAKSCMPGIEGPYAGSLIAEGKAPGRHALMTVEFLSRLITWAID